MRIALTLFLGLLGCVAVRAQLQPVPNGTDLTPRYQVNRTSSLSSSAETVTVQQVGTNPQHSVIFESAWVYCSVACSFTVSQNGAAATATALTITAMNTSPPSAVTAWRGSNVGTGAYVSNAFQVGAGVTIQLDLSKFFLTQNGGTTQNLSIQTNSITGNP